MLKVTEKNLKSSYQKGKIVTMYGANDNQIYCGKHFAIYIYMYQIMRVYMWNKYNVTYQVHLNFKE